MKTAFAILTVAALAFASSSSADAKGCIKGAVVGGVAGHVAGHHGALGAAAGCIVGHHRASEQDKRQQTQGNPRDAQGKMQ
jgi:outer membrane lipoprotein SlyB